jgi:hypothetical protein
MAELVRKVTLGTAVGGEVLDREVPLEGQPTRVHYTREEGFMVWYLVDDEMPETVRHLWIMNDEQDVNEPVPEDQNWDVTVLGTVVVNGTGYHIVEAT